MIVVEDGTIVDGANSYITDDEFTSYCDNRGIDYSEDSDERAELIISARDFIDYTYRDKFQGEQVSRDQLLEFPRKGVSVGRFKIEINEIPRELKTAQIEAAVSSIDIDLYSDSDGTNVQKEKLDVLEVEYFQSGSSGSVILRKVRDVISPLLKNGGKITLERS